MENEKNYKDLIENILAVTYMQELAMHDATIKNKDNNQALKMSILVRRQTLACLLRPIYAYMRSHEMENFRELADIYEKTVKEMIDSGSAAEITDDRVKYMLIHLYTSYDSNC